MPSIVAEYGLIESVDVASFDSQTSDTPNHNNEPGWERLDWIGDDQIVWECNTATERANAIIDNSDDSVLHFRKFGSNWIKNFGKLFFSIF